MTRKRIDSPESKILLREMESDNIDYKDAAELLGVHPTNARRYLEALHAAKLIYVSLWRKSTMKPGPYWPVFDLGDEADATYPGEEIKRQRRIRRQLRERPHVVHPLASLADART